jgi:hypothetical protein
MVTLSEVYLTSDFWLDKTNDYNIGICCFSAKKVWSKENKDWLIWIQSNVSERNDRSICEPLFQWTSNKKISV